MRVLILASFPDSLIQFRGPLLDEIVKKNHVLHVAAPDLIPGSEISQQLAGRDIQVHSLAMQRTGTNPLIDLKALVAMLALIRRIKPDVVLGYTIKPVIFGTLAAWLAGVPNRYALITGLGYAFTGQAKGLRGLVKVLAQGLYRLSLRKAHKVFFQNPDDEALFRCLCLLRPDTPTVVVNGSGVDVASFTVAPLPAGHPHFLLIARLLGDKGVREYAEAAKRIKAANPQVQCSLVGWIDENPDAIRQSELDAWVKAGTISYLGRLQDVRPVIAKCTVYVLPSYREGTPRTVLEAMAMGRAVITTDAPGCRETVLDGENGFLVPVQSADVLVQAMQRFVEDTTLAPRMGLRSRQLAEEKYDVHKVNAVMLLEMGLN